MTAKTRVPDTGGLSTFAQAVILGVDHNMAEVMVQNQGNKKIPVNYSRGKSGIPRAGEQWIISRAYGSWMFDVRIMPTDALPAWTPLALLGGWTALAPTTPAWTAGSGINAVPAYRVNEIHQVQMRGMAAIPGTLSWSNSPGPLAQDVARLPVGARPGTTMVYPVSCAGGTGQMMVFPDGYVRGWAGTGWLALAAVSFLAEG